MNKTRLFVEIIAILISSMIFLIIWMLAGDFMDKFVMSTQVIMLGGVITYYIADKISSLALKQLSTSVKYTKIY